MGRYELLHEKSVACDGAIVKGMHLSYPHTRSGLLLAITILALLALWLTPAHHVSAHEVYVLTPGEIQQGLATPSFDEAAVAWGDLSQFLFWAFITALTIFVVFGVSIIRPLERRLDPVLLRLRRYAEPIARVTIGISFLAAAYFGATYGPELPIVATFGAFTLAIKALLVVLGVLLITNRYVPAAAAAGLALFAYAVWAHGIYMLTYTNYFGELLLLLVALKGRFAPYRFLILRVCFGISLFYASFYAKILHNDLALQVASLPLAGHAHSLAYAFGLEPHFLVLGAAIIELLIATFFILGIEIRFTSLFLLFWLSLSLYYFGEVVWPHIILIGIPIAFICYGYDRYSLEEALMKHRHREPVL